MPNLVSSADLDYMLNQNDAQTEMMIAGMMSLISDTDAKTDAMEKQPWYKRVIFTVFGKNKATKEEIKRNYDKLSAYTAEALSKLYERNKVSERIIVNLGAQINGVYASHLMLQQSHNELKQMLGAFVTKLNAKIESIDKFNMLFQEITLGEYGNEFSPVHIYRIMSQFDLHILKDERKLSNIKKVMQKECLFPTEPVQIGNYLNYIADMEDEHLGVVYLEVQGHLSSKVGQLTVGVIQNWNYLPRTDKALSSKGKVIQNVLVAYDIDSSAEISFEDVYDEMIENKQARPLALPVQVESESTEELLEQGKEYLNTEDYEKAFDCYLKAAEQGHAEAQCELGWFYFGYYDCKRSGVCEDKGKAVFWFKKAAEQDDARAQWALGDRYYYGEGVQEDDEMAVFWFRKAAEQGNHGGQRRLGVCYFWGQGVEQNYETAVHWFKEAAEQGNSKAQRWLGHCYYYGEGVQEDDEMAVFWFRKAAEQGNSEGQSELGECYYRGDGVEQNYETAVHWFKEAAEQGNSKAQWWLGLCYENGNGVVENKETAVLWYTKSAENDDAKGQCELGRCYYFGIGITEDNEEAVLWFEKSAEQGSSRAQYFLAGCYYRGHGLKVDKQKALDLYSEAAAQGDEDAIVALKEFFNGDDATKNETVADLTETQQAKCHGIIHTASAAAGAAAAGLAQIPLSDTAVITPIQITMIVSLGSVFDISLAESAAKSLIAGLGASYAGRAVSQVLFGWIPGLGNMLNATTAAGITEALGWAAVEHFKEQR
ncbi:hypothetical protein AGMMS49957_11500 [Synergistales bacterium]|nr:hypothetical protein AGMMS49957_11500 [Synergistales bacterium]